MRIFRIVLLGLAMALFAINFWAAFIIVIFVLRMVKRDIKNKER